MKYEKSKAQQQRSDDGYKKSAKRQAAKMSRRHGKKLIVAAVYRITVTTHCDTCDGGTKTVELGATPQ